MFDLSIRTISFKCQKCGQSHMVQVSDVTEGRTISCSCGTKTKLVDHRGSLAKGVRDLNSRFKMVQDTIKRINRR